MTRAEYDLLLQREAEMSNRIKERIKAGIMQRKGLDRNSHMLSPLYWSASEQAEYNREMADIKSQVYAAARALGLI